MKIRWRRLGDQLLAAFVHYSVYTVAYVRLVTLHEMNKTFAFVQPLTQICLN